MTFEEKMLITQERYCENMAKQGGFRKTIENAGAAVGRSRNKRIQAIGASIRDAIDSDYARRQYMNVKGVR